MCRFLIAKSKKPINPQKLLDLFAEMCKQSKAPDGTRQEDGWGVAWINQKGEWETKKSLHPIWDDKKTFAEIPETKTLVVHARSATFIQEKGYIEYNQPYIDDKYCFVFNGSLKGVHFTKPISGKIGAQKIWTLLIDQLATKTSSDALITIKNILEKHSKQIIGLNVGIVTQDDAAALCYYSEYKPYYTLYSHRKNMLQLICSEPLPHYAWKHLSKNTVQITD